MKRINLEDFQSLEIRVGKVLYAERIEGTDKLLRLEIDFGTETREVVTGMAQFFEPRHFIGKQIPVLVNLEPRIIQGIESQGMIVAVEAAGQPVLLYPEKEVPLGSIVK